MSKLLKYSGITTKVRAMKSRLLSIDDYQKLSNSETTTEFTAFLKKHPGYSEFFSNLDEQRLHRGEIERVLNDTIYFDYAKIYRFASIEQRKELNIYFSYFEIKLLKTCLQCVFHKESPIVIPHNKTFIGNHSNIKVEALAESKSMDEFIANLKNTEYYSLFLKLQTTNHHTLFDYQMQLDIYYFQKVWKQIKKHVKGSDSKILNNILGKEIDLLNLLWIYRSKKYYNISASNIYSYIIPVSHRLSKSDLNRLVEANSTEELIKVFESTFYHKAYQDLEDISFEELYFKILKKVYKANKMKYPSSIAPIIYYLFLKTRELDRLTSVLECIRYNLDPNETMKYVLQ